MVGFNTSPNSFAAIIVMLRSSPPAPRSSAAASGDDIAWTIALLLPLLPALLALYFTHTRTAVGTLFIAAIALALLSRSRRARSGWPTHSRLAYARVRDRRAPRRRRGRRSRHLSRLAARRIAQLPLALLGGRVVDLHAAPADRRRLGEFREPLRLDAPRPPPRRKRATRTTSSSARSSSSASSAARSRSRGSHGRRGNCRGRSRRRRRKRPQRPPDQLRHLRASARSSPSRSAASLLNMASRSTGRRTANFLILEVFRRLLFLGLIVVAMALVAIRGRTRSVARRPPRAVAALRAADRAGRVLRAQPRRLRPRRAGRDDAVRGGARLCARPADAAAAGPKAAADDRDAAS